MATEPQELLDNGNWLKAPLGGFVIGDPFESLRDELEHEIADVDLSGEDMTKTGIAHMINAIVEDAAQAEDTTEPEHILMPSLRQRTII